MAILVVFDNKVNNCTIDFVNVTSSKFANLDMLLRLRHSINGIKCNGHGSSSMKPLCSILQSYIATYK